MDCLELYCSRSVDTHSRTRLAPSNCRFTAGYMSRYLLNSSSGVMSFGLGYVRSSKVSPTLHTGFLDPSTLLNGMIQNQPRSMRWCRVPPFQGETFGGRRLCGWWLTSSNGLTPM